MRGIPEELDRQLRDEARAANTSVNQVVVETLRAAKLPATGHMHTDLDWFIGGVPATTPESGRADAQAWLDAVPRSIA